MLGIRNSLIFIIILFLGNAAAPLPDDESRDPPLWEHSLSVACNRFPDSPCPASASSAASLCVRRTAAGISSDYRPPVPFARHLDRHEAMVCSQCGQDGIIHAIFSEIGTTSAPTAVEFGARNPDRLNSSHLRINCGWRAILLDSAPGVWTSDSDKAKRVHHELVHRAHVTALNVESKNEVFVD